MSKERPGFDQGQWPNIKHDFVHEIRTSSVTSAAQLRTTASLLYARYEKWPTAEDADEMVEILRKALAKDRSQDDVITCSLDADHRLAGKFY